MKNIIFENEPIIFTNGAFLKPIKVINKEGKEIWLWCVTGFEDDSYLDGEVYNPKVSANSKAELLKEIE